MKRLDIGKDLETPGSAVDRIYVFCASCMGPLSILSILTLKAVVHWRSGVCSPGCTRPCSEHQQDGKMVLDTLCRSSNSLCLSLRRFKIEFLNFRPYISILICILQIEEI